MHNNANYGTRNPVWILAALACLTASEPVQGNPAPDAAAQANNPLANFTAFNLHNYYIGDLTGFDETANQFWMRYARPFSLGESDWILRASLPVVTAPIPPDPGHETGIGDFNIFAAYLVDTGNPSLSLGIGPQLTAPTASHDGLGSEKWSAGFVHTLFNFSSPKFQWGYLLSWQASFAGSGSRNDVNVLGFQPFLFYQLGNGYYLRSSAVMTYNFENDSYTVPVGLGFGRVIPTDKVVYNIFVEPQYSLWDKGGGWPEWQVFLGLNMQFK